MCPRQRTQWSQCTNLRSPTLHRKPYLWGSLAVHPTRLWSRTRKWGRDSPNYARLSASIDLEYLIAQLRGRRSRSLLYLGSRFPIRNSSSEPAPQYTAPDDLDFFALTPYLWCVTQKHGLTLGGVNWSWVAFGQMEESHTHQLPYCSKAYFQLGHLGL